MKFRLLLVTLLISGMGLAITSNEVNKNLSDINSKITQINSDLNKQQQQQQSLDNAIKKSDVALNQSKDLLNNLKKQRDLSLQQLSSIQENLNTLSQSLLVTKEQSTLLINRIYQQMQRLKMDEQSILSGNNHADTSRKKAYLVTILQQEQNQVQVLQNKIDSLNVITKQLQYQIDRLNKQLGTTTQKQMQLKKDKEKQVATASNLNSIIQQKQSQLSTLTHQQAKLNQIMGQILAREQSSRARAKKKLNNSRDSNSSVADKDNDSGYDDNSPFLSRNLVKPLDASTSLGFGQMRDNVVNKGILFNYVANAQVKAVASGKVMYLGDLPGFGKVIIVDHGNNYMSIYSGVISNVKVGNSVSTGQVIANTGTKDNQPLGGFYFELRHLGKPINPSKITG